MVKQPIKKKIEILSDGVFIAHDIRAEKGEKHEVSPEIAKKLIENGHAK